MKSFPFRHFAFLASTILPAFSGDFHTGQAARLLIGQTTFTAQQPASAADTLGGVSGLAVGGNMLIAADSNRVSASPINHRVLIYRNLAQLAMPVSAPVPQGTRCPVCRGHADVVLGQSDFTMTDMKSASQSTLRSPTAVATDGLRLVVADTDNNRVLIWNTIPASNQQNADLVLGQDNFTSTSVKNPPSATTMRGPQGVWIQGERLFVADTQNHRVLIWNSFPGKNSQAPDLVLGQPDFNTKVELDLTQLQVNPKDNNLLNPVSVTSDGQRVFVSDLGFNRVMVWNTIPTRNTQPADLVIGQPDFVSAIANNSTNLCRSNGTDVNSKPIYPALCGRTLDFPRYALSDGTRLFIADGGNDRVLVFNSLPLGNAPTPDAVLGQISDTVNHSSDSAYPLLRSSAATLRTPMSLAWDGSDLFVSDPFNRRILAFSPHDIQVPITGVRNAASVNVFASATLTLGGTIQADDQITVTIQGKAYTYKVLKDDTLPGIVIKLALTVNDGTGDSNVNATPYGAFGVVLLTARKGGEDGNAVTIAVATTPTTAKITLATSGATLTGGQDAATIAPGTLISLVGDGLADREVSAPADAQQLPTHLGGVTLYLDGLEAPLLYVGPNQVNAQMPWETLDSSSISAYLRIEKASGVVTTMPIAVPLVAENPGLFATGTEEPRTAVAQHYSSKATGTVSVDGSAKAGDIATITIEDRPYAYKVVDGDDLTKIRDGLINLINSNQDERVEAFPAGVFTRVRLRAKELGADGNGIPYSASANDGASVIMTATTATLCCANTAGAMITPENPALPGETIVVYGTGLGLVIPEDAKQGLTTGAGYTGPELNEPTAFVSALAGGKTANVLFAGLRQGFIGVYEIQLELNSDLPTTDLTSLTLAQDVYVSNVVYFSVMSPPQGTTGN